VVRIDMASDIVGHYCLRFDKGVVHIVVVGYIVDHYCFMFDTGVVHIIVAGYIVDHYCLMFHSIKSLFRENRSLCGTSIKVGMGTPLSVFV
jgi:hypothetical protein